MTGVFVTGVFAPGYLPRLCSRPAALCERKRRDRTNHNTASAVRAGSTVGLNHRMISSPIRTHLVHRQNSLRTNRHAKAAPFAGFRPEHRSRCLQSLSPPFFLFPFVHSLLSISYPSGPLRVNAIPPSNPDRFRHFSNRFHTISIFCFLLKPFFIFAMMIYIIRYGRF